MSDSNFIMHQVKSFSEGLGVILNNRDGSKTQVFFEQQVGRSNDIKDEINKLLSKSKYTEAVNLVFDEKFIFDRDSYLSLAQWLLSKLDEYNDVDDNLKVELQRSIYKVSRKDV